MLIPHHPILEKVSKVTLQEFMSGFNAIALSVYQDDCDFEVVTLSAATGASSADHGAQTPKSSTVRSLSGKKTEPTATSFYKQRGVKIHSLEVTGYKCTDQHTAEILGQIIQVKKP